MLKYRFFNKIYYKKDGYIYNGWAKTIVCNALACEYGNEMFMQMNNSCSEKDPIPSINAHDL